MSIDVSIICTVYNHEKYLKKCLDGFINQKGINYEIIIHDDASTDKSTDIIREYCEKYPGKFKPIFQKTNQYSQGIPFERLYITPLIEGKYVALCEGDDYWIDEYKLKKQFDALAEHPECNLCVCRVVGKSEDESEIIRFFPCFELNTSVIHSHEFISMLPKGYPFQTSSYFIRSVNYINFKNKSPDFSKYLNGDEALLYYSSAQADVFFIDETMSTYRMFSIGSWNSRYRCRQNDDLIKCKQKFIQGVTLFNEYTGNRYWDIIEREIYGLEIQILRLQGKLKQVFSKNNKVLLKGLSRKQIFALWLESYVNPLFRFCRIWILKIRSFRSRKDVKRRIKRDKNNVQ